MICEGYWQGPLWDTWNAAKLSHVKRRDIRIKRSRVEWDYLICFLPSIFLCVPPVHVYRTLKLTQWQSRKHIKNFLHRIFTVWHLLFMYFYFCVLMFELSKLQFLLSSFVSCVSKAHKNSPSNSSLSISR